MLRDDCRLHRQKWDDRPDYLRATILKACALPKKWTTRRASSSRETIPYPGASVVSVQAPQQVAAPVGELVPPPPATMPVPVPALPAVTTNSKNKYEPSLDSVRRALDEDKLLAFDDFRDKVTMLRGVQRVPMTDENYIDLRTVFEREKNFAAIGKELMRDACFAEAKRLHYDSAIVWVDSIVWDGVPRVERFMHTHFGAVDDEYTRAVSRYMWSGIANRILDPGCQLDMVIVLQSQQGTKKSTGLELLAPEKYMFTDGLSLHIDDDNFKRQIKGKVVVEIAEGAGLSKADIGVIKRNITRKIDRYIEKYQTEETGYPRRCMFFMSVNDLEFLPPDDEHRRWLPIQVAELNRALIERDRAQLYAEGAAIYREHGQQYADAERLAKGRHKAHEQTDVWEIRIAEWLTTPPAAVDVPMPSARLFSTSEVLEGALKMRPDAMAAGHAKRVATVLRMLGYSTKQHKISGRVVRRWSLDVPPPPA
jgi:predicted P-loop ATPase